MAAKRAGGSAKIASLAASFAAGAIARKIITIGWKRVTGHEPPTDPHDPDVALKEALGWSIVMGVGMEASRLLAARAIAKRTARVDAEAELAD
jgi:Protein of unknown function (DUF4235)